MPLEHAAEDEQPDDVLHAADDPEEVVRRVATRRADVAARLSFDVRMWKQIGSSRSTAHSHSGS